MALPRQINSDIDKFTRNFPAGVTLSTADFTLFPGKINIAVSVDSAICFTKPNSTVIFSTYAGKLLVVRTQAGLNFEYQRR